jgi:ketosteroid isomerase-like protein
MPFGQPLYPEYIETSRDELRLKFDDAAAARRYSRVENVVVHETTDPEIVIAEYSLHGETLAAPHHSFVMPLIMVMTIREGVIVHTRDYNSPVARAQSLGTVPQLIAILQQIDVNQNAGDTKKAQ